METDFRRSPALWLGSMAMSLVSIAMAIYEGPAPILALALIGLVLAVVSRAGAASTVATILAVIAIGVEVATSFVMFA